MAAERAMGPLIEVVKEAALAAVREELTGHNEELDELRHMLKAVKGGLAAVKGELKAVKGQLAELMDSRVEQPAEFSRASDEIELRGKSRKRRKEETAEERRREVQEVNWPHATEESAACNEGQRIQDLKLNVELEIRQSEGDRKKALEAIKTASKYFSIDLRHCHRLSDDILGHVSTMAHLRGVVLQHSSGFSAEGIKHLYRLPQLEMLDLFCAKYITDNALEGIWCLTSLKYLYLNNAKLTNAGLAHLRPLSSLNALVLIKCTSVTDAGMVHVGKLTGLEDLSLDGTAVTDAGLRHLSALTNLTNLSLPGGDFYLDGDVRWRINRKW